MSSAASEREIPRSSAGRALSILGDAWTLRILRAAFRGTRRFSDWQAQLDAPRAVLTNRLDRLVERGVLRRRPYQQTPPRHEYRLTPMGLDLWSVFLTMWEWEVTWAPQLPDVRRTLRHLDCGCAMHPVSTCSHCQQPLTWADVQREPGPGAGVEEMPPPRSRRRAPAALTKGDEQGTSVLLRVLGDGWAPLVLAELLRGRHRFTDLQQRLRISPLLLTQRLRELVDETIVVKRPPPQGGSDEYHLTPMGEAMLPWTLQLVRWGNRWLCPDGVPMLYVHAGCGQAFESRLRCSACGEGLRRARLRLV